VKKAGAVVFVLMLVVMCLGISRPALAEDDPTPEGWQVRAITTPVAGVTPSFSSGDDGQIAWTGAGGGNSRMFVYSLATSTNTAISLTLPGSYYNPSMDGPWVAFQGARTGAYDDIFLYDTASRVVQQITSNSAAGDWNDWNPRMDAGRIVWEKDMLGSNPKPGIYMYDVSTGVASLVLAGGEYRDPDISGDYLVCVKNPASAGSTSDIILYKMSSKVATTIASGGKSNEHPRIDGLRVVWTSGDAGADKWPSFQISVYDISTGETRTVTNNVAGNLNPSIEGELVAWETVQPSSIMAYDIGTQTIAQVSLQGDAAHEPEVEDGRIAWHGNKAIYQAVPASEATRFPDVPTGHHYATAIEGMADEAIIEGYTSGYFGPNDPVVRQQFAKMIVLTMAEFYPSQYTATTNDEYEFTDSATIVRTTGELYPYHFVAKAALTGLTVGYSDGTFRPFTKISRQQVITMIVRGASQLLSPPPSNYNGVLSYADPAHGQNIRVAEYNHLLDNIIGPSGTLSSWSTSSNATRAEVAQMLWNLLGHLPTQP